MYKPESKEAERKAAYYVANREKIKARNREYGRKHRNKLKTAGDCKRFCLCGKPAYRVKQGCGVCEPCDKSESIDWVNNRNGTGHDVHYYAVCLGSRRFA